MERKKAGKAETPNKDPEKKTRKVHSGAVKDKARTMNRLVAAVGTVIKTKGYSALSAASVAHECGLNKQLVWTYFGGIDNLVKEYIQQRDFWKQAAGEVIENLLKSPETIGRTEISSLLQNQLELVLNDKALQKIIHWELGEKNKMLREIADEREEIGEQLFNVILPDFSNSGVDLRARLALVIGGIYYLSIHAKTNGSAFCGIDMNLDEGKERIADAIREIIFDAYEKAGVHK